MLATLKREAPEHFASSIALKSSPADLETIRAAITAGYLRELRVGPDLIAFMCDIHGAKEDEAFQVLQYSVVRGALGFSPWGLRRWLTFRGFALGVFGPNADLWFQGTEN